LAAPAPGRFKQRGRVRFQRAPGFGHEDRGFGVALKFLENLLKETPRLDCCIISLLHEPEEGRSASQKCEQFLDTLFSATNSQGLSLYFCTLGGSLILQRKENVRTWISKEIAEQHLSVGENTYF
jgi:hypothetical protein